MIDTLSNPTRLVAICDECHLEAPLEARTMLAAHREAKALGWDVSRNGFGERHHVCPACCNDPRNIRDAQG